MGNICIDFSLTNIWHSWYKFKKGKKRTFEFEKICYYLENNLFGIHQDLISKKYKHGAYRKFFVTDNKKREVSVASVKDRVVHRLVYEYLVEVFDQTLQYDAWSCRSNKGLLAAIERAQKFTRKFKKGYFWRADVKKFFDNVDHQVLLKLLKRRIQDQKAIWLLEEIIDSFKIGIPIGNLTSQIFANIYLNELDRFVKHNLKVRAYLRYADDFVIFEDNFDRLKIIRENVIKFVDENLKLEIKKEIILKTKRGLKYLGVEIFPQGRRLSKRNLRRIFLRLDQRNFAGYYGLIKEHQRKKLKEFNWRIMEKINNE